MSLIKKVKISKDADHGKNYGVISVQRYNGKINNFQYGAEMTSNTISTFGGIYGVAWGIGWEGGRLITNIPGYHEYFRVPVGKVLFPKKHGNDAKNINNYGIFF